MLDFDFDILYAVSVFGLFTNCSYYKRFGKRIVVYRVLPFEFSREIYTPHQWEENNRLSDALELYRKDMGDIIGGGTGADYFLSGATIFPT